MSRAKGPSIAETIERLDGDDLDRFLRDHLRRRDLHGVVANLNAAVLSKSDPASQQARAALARLGFAD